MKKPNEWHYYVAVRDVSRAYSKHARKLKDSEGRAFSSEASRAFNALKMIRRNMKPKVSKIISERTERETTRAVRTYISNQRPRTSVTVRVGKKTSLEKNHRGNMTVDVGYLWGRNVGKRLYERGYESPWFVLSAVELSVNAKNVELFSVKAHNLDTNEERDGFVSSNTVGNRKFFFAVTANTAVSRAVGEMMEQMTETLTGEKQ